MKISYDRSSRRRANFIIRNKEKAQKRRLVHYHLLAGIQEDFRSEAQRESCSRVKNREEIADGRMRIIRGLAYKEAFIRNV